MPKKTPEIPTTQITAVLRKSTLDTARNIGVEVGFSGEWNDVTQEVGQLDNALAVRNFKRESWKSSQRIWERMMLILVLIFDAYQMKVGLEQGPGYVAENVFPVALATAVFLLLVNILENQVHMRETNDTLFEQQEWALLLAQYRDELGELRNQHNTE